jgi:hypothetical protein
VSDKKQQRQTGKKAPASTQHYPKEECGIVGVYNVEEAANHAYLGAYAQQHRGQESAGIVSSDGERLYRYAGMGKVADVFTPTEDSPAFGSPRNFTQPLFDYRRELFAQRAADSF